MSEPARAALAHTALAIVTTAAPLAAPASDVRCHQWTQHGADTNAISTSRTSRRSDPGTGPVRGQASRLSTQAHRRSVRAAQP